MVWRGFGFAVVALVSALVAGGCQSIVGIPERTFQPHSQQCVDYCNTVQKNCTGDNAVYPDKTTCLDVCGKLPPGQASSPANADTVACRMRQAQTAASSPSESCAAAGPGGGGDGTCGSDCDAYCTLFQAICPADFKLVSDCKTKCAAIADDKGFTAAEQKGDTVQCRLAQLEKATQDKSACLHARFQSSGGVCSHDPTTPVDCADYCRAVSVACTGDLQQYHATKTHSAHDECMAVCADLSKQHAGKWSDTLGQSVGCRYYHTFFALGDPGTHCPHAGPGGDGTCSDPKTANCQSYCILLEAGCSSVFSTRYPGGQSDCLQACKNTPGADAGQLYSTDTSSGTTKHVPSQMACYLQLVSAAIVDQAPSECPDLTKPCTQN